MKKLTTRMTALLLALLMVFSVCGCAGGSEGGSNDVFEPMEGETPVDLEGYEFTVVDFSGGRWNREKSGTPFADAWIQIMDEVEYLYNCKISATYTSAQEIFTTVQPEIAAGGKYADLIITTEYAIGAFLGAGLFTNLNDLDVNWDNEWWNKSLRACTEYNGKQYVAGGSFIFDTAQTWLMYYNEALWDQHGFEDPYKLVDEGRWTYDVFRQYCQTAAEDRDQSGKLDSSEDIYGIIAANGDFCDAWFQAMGGHFFKSDEESGKVVLACNTTKTFDIVEKMYNMIQKDDVYGFLGLGEAEHVQQFVNGGALLYAYMPGRDGLQDMEDDWGVIPMPKLDESQEDYLSGVDHNAAVFGIANTNTDLYEVGVLLEALGRHSMILEDIFWPDYKETYWRHEEDDTRMVAEYVVGHGQHDMALIMARCNTAFSAPRTRLFQTVFGSAGPDFSSYIETVEDTIETVIQDYFEFEEEGDEGGEEAA